MAENCRQYIVEFVKRNIDRQNETGWIMPGK